MYNKVRARDGGDAKKDSMPTKDVHEKYLYRILPLEWFLQMLKTGNNTLVRPDKWDDPFEQLITKYAHLDLRKNVWFPNEKPTLYGAMEKTDWFAQCWSKSSNSDALWRVFSHDTKQRCVKIVTTFDLLEQSVEHINPKEASFFIDDVAYAKTLKKDYPSILKQWFDKYKERTKSFKQCCELSLLLTKRWAFKHEEEVRLLVYAPSKDKDKVFPYKFNLDNILRIELDPWTPIEAVDSIKDAIGGLNPAMAKLTKRSSLYDEINTKKGFLFIISDDQIEYSISGKALEGKRRLKYGGAKYPPKRNRVEVISLEDKEQE